MKAFFTLLIVAIASTVNYAIGQNTPPGAALSFDGINDYVRVAGGGGLNNLQSGTIEMWVKWHGNNQDGADGSLPNYGPVLSRQSNDEFSNQIISLNSANPGTAKIVWKPYNAYSNAITGNTSPDNGWNHIAIVYSSGDHKLYLNGVLDGSSTETGVMGNNSSVALGIGGWIGEGVRYGNADIDEVRIWNVMKTESEIQASMNCELPAGTPGLLANYHFNQGIEGVDNTGETTLFDLSGNASNGTLNNFTLNGSASNWIAAGGVISGTNCNPCPNPVIPAVSISITGGSMPVCQGENLTFTATAVNGGSNPTYEWMVIFAGDSVVIGNLPTLTYSAFFNNGVTNSIQCKLTSNDPCATQPLVFSNNLDIATTYGPVWYLDADGDQYYSGSLIAACTSPGAGYTTLVIPGGDCNDNNPAVRPGATEICSNGIDDNCNGQIDEGCNVPSTWYRDNDGDSYGNANLSRISITKPGGFVNRAGDCKDTDPTVYPGAHELCDGKDNNCNGLKDDGAPGTRTWYRDADNDGRGRNTVTKIACSKPTGFVDSANDCNDADATIYQGAPELCDGKDNNCNGLVDDGLPGTKVWYQDVDGDGYGARVRRKTSCPQPVGYVADSTDCRDNDRTIYPGAPELCDGKDNNCNGLKDESCTLIVSTTPTTSILSSKTIVEPVAPVLEASLWPNPARTEVMVAFDKFAPNQKVEMVLMTAEGRSLKAESLMPTVKGQQVRFDVSNISSGFYLLRIKQGLLTETKRVVVAHYR